MSREGQDAIWENQAADHHLIPGSKIAPEIEKFQAQGLKFTEMNVPFLQRSNPAEVERLRGEGFGVILEIDVQGAEQVRRLCPENVSVFLMAPSNEDYEKRLVVRHTDDAATIRRRVERARRELERAGEYDYQIVNDNLDEAVAALHRVVAGAFER